MKNKCPCLNHSHTQKTKKQNQVCWKKQVQSTEFVVSKWQCIEEAPNLCVVQFECKLLQQQWLDETVELLSLCQSDQKIPPPNVQPLLCCSRLTSTRLCDQLPNSIVQVGESQGNCMNVVVRGQRRMKRQWIRKGKFRRERCSKVQSAANTAGRDKRTVPFDWTTEFSREIARVFGLSAFCEPNTDAQWLHRVKLKRYSPQEWCQEPKSCTHHQHQDQFEACQYSSPSIAILSPPRPSHTTPEQHPISAKLYQGNCDQPTLNSSRPFAKSMSL